MGNHSAPLTERKYLLPFVLVTSLFFLWALGVNLNDILIPHLKKTSSLTDAVSSPGFKLLFWRIFPRSAAMGMADGAHRLS